MKNVKKVFIIIGLILLVGASCYVTYRITARNTQSRADKTYAELETRYRDLDKSNIELRKINTGLEANNIKLGKELKNSNGFVVRTREITTALESEITGAASTIKRIELTVVAIEKIIEQLPDKIIILEENNSD